ncbi:MAG: type II secretion system F family protein [Bdellovibrionales bacterium]
MKILDLMRDNPDATAGLMGLMAVGVVWLVWKALIDADPLPARLKSIQDRRAALKAEYMRQAEQKKKEKGSDKHLSFFRQISSWLKLQQMTGLDEVRKKLIRAGYRSRDALPVFLVLQIGLPVVVLGILVVFLFVLAPPADLSATMRTLICLFFAILMGLLPNMLVKNKTDKRMNDLRKQLPDAFDLLVICAEAGLSLDSALDRVSKEVMHSAPDLGEELALTSVELSFMPERQMALRSFADRVPIQGVQALVSTLIQTERYGTPLAQALRILSGEMRDERMMRAEEKAARLPATLTVPMILFILPPLFIVLVGPAGIKVSRTLSKVGGQ